MTRRLVNFVHVCSSPEDQTRENHETWPQETKLGSALIKIRRACIVDIPLKKVERQARLSQYIGAHFTPTAQGTLEYRDAACPFCKHFLFYGL